MRGGRRTERESAGFTEKWFHGIIVSERNGYCEAVFYKSEKNKMEKSPLDTEIYPRSGDFL